MKGQDFSNAGDMVSYGCWCQIRNQEAEGIVPGHGTPVDELDAACKKWHQCRACTTIDFSTEEKCDPNDVSYQVNFDPVTMRLTCEQLQPGWSQQISKPNIEQCRVSNYQ